MIVDTSALVAILYGEPEGPDFIQSLLESNVRRISVANLLELHMVVEGQLGPDAAREADRFLERADITVEPVTLEQGRIARQAFLDYGKGRHKAGLNFGDCFAYALAKSTGEPLLFKGYDFARTDLPSA